MSIHSRLSAALRREFAKWNRWDWAMAVAATALFVFVMATVLSPALYAQTWGILYGREVQIIGSTATLKLHGSEDASGTSAGFELRYTGGNKFDFYTGPSIGNTIEFIAGSTTGETTWLEINTPTISPSPVFKASVAFESFFSGVGGTHTAQTGWNVAATTNAIQIHDTDASANTFYIVGDGTNYWGSAKDTNLYRSAANVLKTDDALHVAGLLVPLANGGAAPAATCTPYEIWIDTDQADDTNCTTTSDNSLCLCVATDTWVELDNN